MAFFLNFLLFIFLIVVVVVLFFVVHIYLAMKKVKDKFKKPNSNNDGGFSSTRTSTRNGDHITDTRDPSKAHRKIIADDEGEYVDFVEE